MDTLEFPKVLLFRELGDSFLLLLKAQLLPSNPSDVTVVVTDFSYFARIFFRVMDHMQQQ